MKGDIKYFKVYIVKSDLMEIQVRDCVKLTSTYAYVRPLRSAGTCFNTKICLSQISSKYFRTMDDAVHYIHTEKQKEIEKIRGKIKELESLIKKTEDSKSGYYTVENWDYDDRR